MRGFSGTPSPSHVHRSRLAFDFRHDILAGKLAWLPARDSPLSGESFGLLRPGAHEGPKRSAEQAGEDA